MDRGVSGLRPLGVGGGVSPDCFDPGVAGEKRPLPALVSSSAASQGVCVPQRGSSDPAACAAASPESCGGRSWEFYRGGGVIGWGHSRSDRCRAGTRPSIFFFFSLPRRAEKRSPGCMWSLPDQWTCNDDLCWFCANCYCIEILRASYCTVFCF
jgi:hypothetical protein